MKNKFKHYGVDSLYQTLRHPFEEDLKKNNINYVFLPLTEKVIKYNVEKKVRYAYITYPNVHPEEGYIENVYITEAIPDDMNWEKLKEDYELQRQGKQPMKIPTRTRILYDKAIEMANDERETNPQDFLNWLEPPSKADIDVALMHLGSSLEELRGSDHHDVPEIDKLLENM